MKGPCCVPGFFQAAKSTTTTTTVFSNRQEDTATTAQEEKRQMHPDLKDALEATVTASAVPDITTAIHSSFRTNVWSRITVWGAIVTALWVPYEMAFVLGGKASSIYVSLADTCLWGIFVADFLVTYFGTENAPKNRKNETYPPNNMLFWVDIVGIFPLEAAALGIAAFLSPIDAEAGTSDMFSMFSLFRLFSLVRLHRLLPVSDGLQNNPRIPLITFTLARNFAVLFTVNHISACVMYFLALRHGFDEHTWLGPLTSVSNMNGVERYVVSLYQSVETFSTVGYGDFAPGNAAEQIWGVMFMFLNVVLQSWVFGSITLLILKSDEKTGDYRDALETLDQYSSINQFDEPLIANLKTQLQLDFNSRQVSDKQVLQNYPNSVQRNILRKLYLPHLLQTNLMDGVPAQFLDTYLTSCSVEMFSPGEAIVERQSIVADLFLLVSGTAEIVHDPNSRGRNVVLQEGDFIGEVAFLTDSRQTDSVLCTTVCKTLTMTRETYRELCVENPGSAGKILKNLQSTVVDKSAIGDAIGQPPAQGDDKIAAMKNLIHLHMRKQQDDHTTRFLFAASRGDKNAISRMCEQGFDPNNADYDSRTALMVGAMSGNAETVTVLLNYGADPNRVDVHGSREKRP